MRPRTTGTAAERELAISLATSTRSRAAASIASPIATYASAGRSDASVGPAASSCRTVARTSRTMELYASVLCCTVSDPLATCTRTALSCRPTASSRPRRSSDPRQAAARSTACRSAASASALAERSCAVVAAPGRRLASTAAVRSSASAAREPVLGERLLGRAAVLAQRRRLPPVVHRRRDGEAEQHGDRQEREQHQLRADAQPSEQRRSRPRCAGGYALISGTGVGSTGGREDQNLLVVRPRQGRAPPAVPGRRSPGKRGRRPALSAG